MVTRGRFGMLCQDVSIAQVKRPHASAVAITKDDSGSAIFVFDCLGKNRIDIDIATRSSDTHGFATVDIRAFLDVLRSWLHTVDTPGFNDLDEIVWNSLIKGDFDRTLQIELTRHTAKCGNNVLIVYKPSADDLETFLSDINWPAGEVFSGLRLEMPADKFTAGVRTLLRFHDALPV